MKSFELQPSIAWNFRGFQTILPSMYFNRDDILLTVQLMPLRAGEKRPHILVYATLTTNGHWQTLYLVLDEEYKGKSNDDDEALSKEIINQLQENREMLDHIEQLLDYLEEDPEDE